ncbi:hypothetical protein ABT289_03120 [Streptomyces fimicarius]|uniref:hypothetical protein n=1 Tax=Streptomyces griseus TaxID=1911 RepID=UPI0033167AF6
MDSGIAALLGAGIGVAGTFGTTWLSGWSVVRGQHGHWRRQGRREAYIAFIARVMAFREAADSLLSIMDDKHTRDDAAQALEQVLARFPAVVAAFPAVAVEGPEDVATRARSMTKAVTKAVTDLEFYATAARRFGRPGQFEAGRVRKRLVVVDEDLNKFAEEARASLDSRKV